MLLPHKRTLGTLVSDYEKKQAGCMTCQFVFIEAYVMFARSPSKGFNTTMIIVTKA